MADQPLQGNDWRSAPLRVVWVLTGVKYGRGYEEEDCKEIIGVYESSTVAQAVVDLCGDEFDDYAWNPYPVVPAGQVAEVQEARRS